MSNPTPDWRQFLSEETAATSIEYALIASIAAVAAIASLHYLSTTMSDMFTHVTNSVDAAGSGS